MSVGHLYVLEIQCLFRSSAHLKIWYWIFFFFFGCWTVWVPASGTYNSQNCKLKGSTGVEPCANRKYTVSNARLYTEAHAFSYSCLKSTLVGVSQTTVWSEDISCHITKQEMSQPSAISGLQMWMRAPQAAIQWMLVIAEELGECKKQGEQGNRISPR